MRMIDGDALYKQLQDAEILARNRVLDTKLSLPNPTNTNPSYMRYSTQLDERIRLKHMVADAPTIRTEPQWIPCSERLPEADDMYMFPKHYYLCQRNVYGVMQMFVGARLGDTDAPLHDFWDWYGTRIREEEVVAWMPLPEQYQPKEEE